MKFLSGPVLGILVVSTVCPAASRPQNSADSKDAGAREAIVRLEREWLHVHDTKTLGGILADDFVHVLPAGFVTKAEEIGWRIQHGWPEGEEQRKFEDLRVRVYGNTAIANGLVAATNPKTGKVRRTRFTDVFVQRGSRWQAVDAQEMEIK